MAIKKQEFYEGAALHLLARSGSIKGVTYDNPVFIVNGKVILHLKYCTKNRSPWGFTFMPDEQRLLQERAQRGTLVIGLVCGSDGVAAVDYSAFAEIAPVKDASIHVACYRHHGQHYEVSGPEGSLSRKIPPSLWQRILDREDR